jgi:ABC-2 type transport system permease protein
VSIAGSLALFVGGVDKSLFDHLMSIMIATQVISMPQFGLLVLAFFIILSLLGSTTPPGSKPVTLQRITQFSPSIQFVSFAQAIFYRGAGLDVVWQDCGVIAARGLAVMHFRRMLVQIRA